MADPSSTQRDERVWRVVAGGPLPGHLAARTLGLTLAEQLRRDGRRLVEATAAGAPWATTRVGSS